MSGTRSLVMLAVFNLIGLIVVIVVNVLATTVPLGGKTTGELSAALPNLFVPSGITFSIWGVIYLLLAVFVGYGLLESIRNTEAAQRFLARIGLLFVVTCVANVGWIFAWHYQLLPLSLVWMAILLLSLIRIYLRLGVGRTHAAPLEKYLVHLPMSVYLGWITIAAIANVTAVLVAYNWEGFGISDQVWASVMITIGVALALVMLFDRNDIFYTLVVDWALLGILIRRTVESDIPAQGVVITSLVGIGVLTAAVVYQVARRRVYHEPARH